jgi:hypothetical protein
LPDHPDHIQRPLNLRFGEAAALIGMSPAAPHGRAGEIITITLYWRAIGPAAATSGGSLQSYLHSVGSEVVKRDSLPATGNRLSTDWQPGEAWAERYVILLPPEADAQRTYPLVAGLYDPGQGALSATQDGTLTEPIIGRIAINGEPHAGDYRYRIGDSIGLAEPDITRGAGTLTICLTFRALATMQADHAIFVHLLPETPGPPLSQADAQPRAGAYPTSAWQPGETIRDCVTLPMPADGNASESADGQALHVGLGVYEPASGVRLAVRDKTGELVPDAMLIVTVPR